MFFGRFFSKRRNKSGEPPERAKALMQETVNTPDTSVDAVDRSLDDESKTVQETFRGAFYGVGVDLALNSAARRGAFENLPGKGKPLSFLNDTDDENWMVNRVIKEGNYLPPWLELHHKIRDFIASALKAIDQGSGTDLDETISEINSLIQKFNAECPSPSMQRSLVRRERLAEQYERWK